MIEWFDLNLNTRLVLLALCCLGAAESLRARGPGYRASAALLAAAGVMSVAFSAYSTPGALRWSYFATTAVAIGTFAAVAISLRAPQSIRAVQGTTRITLSASRPLARSCPASRAMPYSPTAGRALFTGAPRNPVETRYPL